MERLTRNDFALAVGLALLAGYVDALGFLTTGGFFVSFMSGNSTRLGVGAGLARWSAAVAAGSLIAAFVAGVTMGTLAAHFGRRPRASVMVLVTALLAAATAARVGAAGLVAAALLAMAMGSENAVFQGSAITGGGPTFGVTYMTGALVKIGQGLARTVLGEAGGPWLRFLGLWAGLSLGAVLGAVVWTALPGAAFGVALLGAMGLTAWTWRAGLPSPSRGEGRGMGA